ncbi:Gfo/Idh/MocA family oxidoreductase [Enterococcus timonensis]|uniref:Gfo/Idh/MocA family oxidoreductase n=1 Tax=Enterococcus timonensis TaxID=1852364 RepID=UPI0008D9E6DC|nr:Gfo/Idh/MocA family oxidoreductase [Enterococcus timonensis]
MKKITMGIVGYGGMGSYHVRELIKNEEKFQLKGGFDILPQRQSALKEAGYLAYESYQALLDDPEIELILIATPNDTHKELAVTALNSKKHVLTEKPAMMNATELEEVLAIAEKNQREFFVHQNRRWDEDFRIISEIFNQQEIGAIFKIESRVHGANGIPGDWRHYKAQGGGMVLDWGVHLLDQMLFLVPGKIEKVQADLSYVLGNDVDDGFNTTLYFENGLTVLVEVGTSNYLKLPRWYLKGLKGTAEIIDWDLTGEMVQATGIDTAAPKPIQAGVGLTKTMAPPTEGAMRRLPLPKGEALPVSIYENIYEVIENKGQRIVKNEEVLRVLHLMEIIFEAGSRQEILPFE